MALVTSSEKSKYYSHREQHVYPAHSDSKHENKTLTANKIQTAGANEDNLDLSPTAREILKSIDGEFSDLLHRHSRYADDFLGTLKLEGSNPVMRGLFFLTRNKSYLNNPHNVNNATSDERFGSFYNELKELAEESQKLYAKVQKSMRSPFNHSNYYGMR